MDENIATRIEVHEVQIASNKEAIEELKKRRAEDRDRDATIAELSTQVASLRGEVNTLRAELSGRADAHDGREKITWSLLGAIILGMIAQAMSSWAGGIP